MKPNEVELLKAYIKKELQKRKGVEINYNLSNPREHYYHLTRPLFLKYSQSISKLDKDDLLTLIALVYSWMPTIPKVSYSQDIDERLNKAVLFLNKIKIWDIDMEHLEKYSDDFSNLKWIINKSDVGMSKVLHFVNPDLFCIYDKRIDENIRKITGVSRKISFLKLCQIFYAIKNQLRINMKEVDLILWAISDNNINCTRRDIPL